MLERKCSKCKTWNQGNDFCINCGVAISPSQINKEEQERKRKKEIEVEKNKKPSAIEIFARKVKNHKSPFVKVIYYFFYSIWAIYVFILGLILYLVAASPG